VFPDARFVRQYDTAVRTRGRSAQMRTATRLRDHVLKKMGGFEIDGWRARTTLSVK
jgi:hypothetical protein